MVELNFDTADVILEWTLDVSRYANILISIGEIIIFRGASVRYIYCQKDQHVETIIFGQLDHFWAALWTKKFALSQNCNFENGVIVKISNS